MDEFGSRTIVLQEIEKEGTARKIGRADILGKIISAPYYLPELSSETDYNFLFDSDYERETVMGYIKPIWFARSKIIERVKSEAYATQSHQKVLGTEKIDQTRFSLRLFEEQKLCIVNPMSQYLYYNAKKEKFYKLEDVPENLPKTIMMFVTEQNLNEYPNIWKRIDTEGYMLELQKEILNYERLGNSDIMLPTTPILDKDSEELVDIAFKANDAMKVAIGMSQLPPSAAADNYLFKGSFFENKTMLHDFISRLYDRYYSTDSPIPIFYQIADDDLSAPEAFEKREGYTELLAAFEDIREKKKTIITMLNGGTLGFASLSKIDGFSEPTNGHLRDRIGGGKKAGTEAVKGGWYDTSKGLDMKEAALKRYIGENDFYPAEGRFGRTFNGRDIDTIETTRWNTTYRRKHRIEERSIEIKHFYEAIGKGANMWLKQKLISSAFSIYNSLI